jgi:AbiV family abortive infection protein
VSARDLTLDQLRKLAPAAARNARDLLTDAEMLLAGERWPRACALAILAREETAKVIKYLSLALLGALKAYNNELNEDDLGKLTLSPALTDLGDPGKLTLARALANKHHVGKLTIGRGLTDWAFPMMAGEQEIPSSAAAASALTEMRARQDNVTKQRALYADIGPDGSLEQPSDIGEAEARSAIANAAVLVRMAEMMTSDPVMQLMANPMEKSLAEVNDLFARVLQAYEQGGDDAAMTVLADQARINRRRFASKDDDPGEDNGSGVVGE